MIEEFENNNLHFTHSKEKVFYLKLRDLAGKGWLIIRSAIGVIVGIAPAAGPTIASFMSYNAAKNNSKEPEKFGKGNNSWIWASETANNAATGGSLVFALSLELMSPAAAVFIECSYYERNSTLSLYYFKIMERFNLYFFCWFLIVNILVFFIGHFFVQVGSFILKTPINCYLQQYYWFVLSELYSETNSMFGVYSTVLISLVAYILMKLKFPMAPFLLSIILVSVMEANLWTTYSMLQGNLIKVFYRPMFIFLLIVAVFSLALPIASKYFKIVLLKILQ